MSDETPQAGAQWLTLVEACQRTGKSEKTVRKWIADGKLDGKKIDLDTGGQAWRVRADSVAAIAPELPNRAPEVASVISQGVPEVLEAGSVDSAIGSEVVPEVPTERAGSVPEVSSIAPEVGSEVLSVDYAAQLIEHQAEEIRFLRAQLEESNRNAAELRAALRESQRIFSKALPAPGEDSLSPAPQDAPGREQSAGAIPTSPPRRNWFQRMFMSEK